MMFPYDLPFLPGSGPPERWDVVVFRYPEEPEVSYIKRLVGLPGETIRISHGDVFVKPPAATRTRSPASRCGTRSRCRSPFTTTDTNREPSGDKPEWQRGRAKTGLGRRPNRCQPVPDQASERANGRSCVTAISCPIPSSGTRSSTTRPRRAAPRHAGHGLLLVQHQHDGRFSTGRPDESQIEEHGCSHTGSAT